MYIKFYSIKISKHFAIPTLIMFHHIASGFVFFLFSYWWMQWRDEFVSLHSIYLFQLKKQAHFNCNFSTTWCVVSSLKWSLASSLFHSINIIMVQIIIFKWIWSEWMGKKRVICYNIAFNWIKAHFGAFEISFCLVARFCCCYWSCRHQHCSFQKCQFFLPFKS
jgi:hypothetical protein